MASNGNSDCSVTATTTLTDAAAASSLASACPTFTGDIAIGTDVSGDLTLDGMQELDGSLLINNVTQLTAISSDSLVNITENLSLAALTILSTFSFSKLSSIGTLSLTSLPAAQSLSFLQTLQQLSAIEIQNTQLNSLEGFSLDTISDVTIGGCIRELRDFRPRPVLSADRDERATANNYYLNTINLQPYNLTGRLVIEANGRDLEVSMPNIVFAQNMTFRNCTSISFPSITQVNGSLGLYGNYITEFNGAPLLRAVDGGLSFVSNYAMANISLPELQTVAGGFQVANNTNLTTLDELYSLKLISGAVDLDGNFTDISFPSLNEVRGSFIVRSSEDLSCNAFDELAANNSIKGLYRCTTASDSGNATRATSANSTSSGTSGIPAATSTATTATSPQSSSNGLSTGAKAGIGVGVAIGALLLICGVVLLLRRRRSKRKSGNSNMPAEKDGAEVDKAAMLDSDVQKHELEQPTQEMPIGNEAQELPAKHGNVELGRNASTKAAPGIESRHEMPANETPRVSDVEERKQDSHET